MPNRARKLVLSTFTQTEVVDPSHVGATRINLSKTAQYHITPVTQNLFEYDSELGTRETLTTVQYNLFPIVVDSKRIPWTEANIYILDRIKNSISFVMATYSNIASDLAAYRQFLDEFEIGWEVFDKNKLYRPTYRYRAYLRSLIDTDEVSVSSARRRMSSVIAFYRWLQSEGVLKPDFPMWRESDQYIDIKNEYGISFSKKIKSTDVSIKVVKSQNPYADTISDGGQLRPLFKEEQFWLLKALIALNNTEMFLIHLLALASGARLQTILTIRLHHVLTDMSGSNLNEIRIPAGPSTGIDTKNNKKLVLHLPLWLYQKLHIYANSENAKKRRVKSSLGNSEVQFLFLSNRGKPYYQSKDEIQTFRQEFDLHHSKNGQTVRQFINDKIIPYIREEEAKPKFRYRFHDLRATYGMNLTDEQLENVARGRISLHQAREFVRVRMCHESSATTDLYLQYRQNLMHIRQVASSYNDHLCEIVNRLELGY